MQEYLFQGMEYVYAVYSAGSFRGAAERLFVSQPSVSASVRRVEERLGMPIFDRSVKPLCLTEFGRQYISMAEQIMAMENQLVEYVNDSGALLRGRLALGGSTLFSAMIFPPILSRFREKYPGIELELIEDTTGKLEAMLQSGSVDLMIDYEVAHPELCGWSVLENELILLAVPKRLPIHAELRGYRIEPQKLLEGEAAIDSTPPVPLSRFREIPFILLKTGNDSRRRADALCAAQGFTPNALLEFDQQMTSYHVSCSGIGACFVSSILVRRLGPSRDMVYYRLSGEESRRQIRLFWKKGRYFSRAMEEFRAFSEKK